MAKIEIDVSIVATVSTNIVATIASAPTISGSSAATRLRKKRNASASRIGNASASARLRPLTTCSLTSSCATTGPPTTTPRSPRSVSISRSTASSRCWVEVALSCAVMNVERPSRETKSRDCVEAKSATRATSGSDATVRAMAATRSERGSVPCTSTTTSVPK